MARRGATKRQAQERRPVGPGSGDRGRGETLSRVLLVVLGLDAIIAIVQLYVHLQITGSDGSYTSFCNVNSNINCDAVLGSHFGKLFGLPVSLWALGKDAAMAALVGYRGRPGSPARVQAALALAALGVWSLVFSLYMGAIATIQIGAFCLLCAGMYVLSPIIAYLAWRVAESRLGAAGPLLTGNRGAIGAGGIAVGVAVISAVQFGLIGGGATTRAEVCAADPAFCQWYDSQKEVNGLPTARHAKGPEDAPITIVEFSDFECTFCAQAFRDLRDLQRTQPGMTRIVFHHFPLDSSCNPNVEESMHRQACLAAIAAECAARYGEFWRYHDRLFDAQGNLSRDALISTATDLGLDADAFTECLDDPATLELVVADAKAGARLGVQSTPTLYINGKEVAGALPRSKYDDVLILELES